jgi:hypothetical protein
LSSITSLSKEDLESLRYARHLLEHPGLAAKIANLFGTPIEKGFELLPARWHGVVQRATRKSLQTALDVALLTMDAKKRRTSSETIHKILVAAAGAGGGAFGIPTLAIELPVSTTVMLRSIADIARSEGENIKLVETKLACLEVFALGGTSGGDDRAETGYFAVRAAMAQAVSEAVQHLVERGLSQRGSPAVIRFITALAPRFGVVVSEKVAAQAIPLVGAAGGALINTVFIDHFQDMARGHFIVRRLERAYGTRLVRQQYESL